MSARRDDNERFVRDVLARTSGSPCRRCEDQLPDLADGVLADLDRQLVQAHLEHCTACRALAVAMSTSAPVLPQLAVVDPGEAFTAAVLGRTSRRQRLAAPPAHARPTGLPGLMDRVGRWWGGWLLQPGFAAQAAYALTVVLVLATVVPGSPLRGVPGKALQVMRAGPTAVAPLDNAVQWVDGRGDAAQVAVRGRVRQLDNGLDGRLARSAVERSRAARGFGDAFEELQNGRLGGAGLAGLGALDASRRAWNLWWHGQSPQASE